MEAKSSGPSSEEVVSHCGGSAIVRFPYELKEIYEERSLEYPPREREYEHDSDGNPNFPYEFQEHCLLGDALRLKGHDGNPAGTSAKSNPFTLDNGLELTYGMINGLAGDFFGTAQPISDGQHIQEMKRRFIEAYVTLALWSVEATKANELLDALETEREAVDEAIRNGEDPSTAYDKMSTVRATARFQWITFWRSGPSYLTLASLNVDHFGADARTTYNAGHLVALEEAAKGDRDNLLRAYTMNAFADHFVQDSFASGHIRTPRRKLSGAWSLAAKKMHDEDNKRGLFVSSPPGSSFAEWQSFGDSKLFDKVNEKGMHQCLLALNESVDEVYEAWQTKKVIDPRDFKAWRNAPTLESEFSSKNFPPMYDVD